MTVLLPVLGIVAGLALLTYASDHFVVGSARIAVMLRLSSVVVGAVVIGFGTSTPELLVSALAGLEGSIDIAVANIVGSNIANLMLVLGLAALVGPIAVRSITIKREGPLAVLGVIVFGIVVQGGVVAWEAVVLVALLVVSLVIIVWSSRRGHDVLADEVEEFLADGPPSMRPELRRAVLGLVGTLAGAQVLVISATAIADRAGLSEGFVGLTVVAVGTSLPELATSLQAARRGETDLIVGNLLGSNLFNALAVGATAVAAGAGQVASATITGAGVIIMVVTSVIALGFMVTGARVSRGEGAVLVAGYLGVLPLLAR